MLPCDADRLSELRNTRSYQDRMQYRALQIPVEKTALFFARHINRWNGADLDWLYQRELAGALLAEQDKRAGA